jgi:hypothetical protein
MITISEVRNAQSLNSENTAFNVEINHPEFGWIPYALQPDDIDNTVDNSVLINLIGSNYAAYVAPTQEEINAELSEDIRDYRAFLLATEVDPLVTNPLRWAGLTESKQAEWTQYRTDLLNLSEQDTFPSSVTWPTKPS